MPVIIPTAERKETLRTIYNLLLDYKLNGTTQSIGNAVAKMLTVREFAVDRIKDPKFRIPTCNPEGVALAWKFVYFFLYQRDYVSASLILWGAKTFTPEPHCAQMMWNGLFERSLINVMGSASTGKTFCPSAWCMLDWLLDPEWTRIQVVSNSEDHVKKNLFADIVRLHEEAALEMPGIVDSESISLNKKRAMGIFILTIPGGPTSRGKLKGSKVKNRPYHPLFGENSRLRFILDEAQEIPANVWDEIPNLLASVDNSIEHIKLIAAANPKLEFSRYGQNCKPKGGYEKITDDTEEWESETGWWVISINAMKTENVMQKKTIFPRMITYEGVQKIIRSQAGGDPNHPICFTYVYGRFPKTGLMNQVIKTEHLRTAEREWIFDDRTSAKAGADPAFTGDRPALAYGRVGRAIGWIDYSGNRHMLDAPKMAIQLDAVTEVARGDSQDLADNYMEPMKTLGVEPDGFGIDMTGAGRGTHDIIRRQWAKKIGALKDGSEVAKIHGIEYGSSPTEIKIVEEDTATPKEQFNIMATELWFAAAKLFEFDVIGIGKGVDIQVFQELAARQGGMQVGLGKKLTVESKSEYKRRTGLPSPDLADASLIMISVARWTTPGLIPRAKDTAPPKPERGVAAWAGFNQRFGSAEMVGMAGPGGLVDTVKD